MYIILLPIRRALSQTALGSEGGGVYIISLSTDSYSKGHTNICSKDSAVGWEGGEVDCILDRLSTNTLARMCKTTTEVSIHSHFDQDLARSYI